MLAKLLVLLTPGMMLAGLSGSDPPVGTAAPSGYDQSLRQQQVRIEQRVIIRVAPMGFARRAVERRPGSASEPSYRERKVGKCVTMDEIAGVRAESEERLVLLMRDRRLVRADLDATCRAHEFYSGFYVERSRDGRLCVDRDMLRARSGASCSLSRLRGLVPIGD